MINVNLLKGIFLMGKVSKFLAVGWYSPPISRVRKVRVKGEQSTPGGGNKTKSREETFLVRMGIQSVYFWEIILLDSALY